MDDMIGLFGAFTKKHTIQHVVNEVLATSWNAQVWTLIRFAEYIL